MSSRGVDKSKRAFVLRRDGHECQWCRGHDAHLLRPIDQGLTLDHVIPRSKNGSCKVENLIAACHRCNSRRQDMTIKQFAEWVSTITGEAVEAIRRRVRDRGRRTKKMKEESWAVKRKR